MSSLGAAVILTAGCSGSVESVTSTDAGGARGSTPNAEAKITTTSGTALDPNRPAPDTIDPATMVPQPGAAPVPPPDLPWGSPAGPSGGPNTTIPDPNTSLPTPEPPPVPTVPATGDDPAFIDCGVVYRASGWPTTFVPSPTTFACLADAFAAGTPARLVDREQTDGQGGAILVTTYDVLGPGVLRMTVDATNAADRPQVVTVSRCTGVVAEMMSLVVSGCTVTG
jgi:hypothetical protein